MTDNDIDKWIEECADLTRNGKQEHYWVFDISSDDIRQIVRAALDRFGAALAAAMIEQLCCKLLDLCELARPHVDPDEIAEAERIVDTAHRMIYDD